MPPTQPRTLRITFSPRGPFRKRAQVAEAPHPLSSPPASTHSPLVTQVFPREGLLHGRVIPGTQVQVILVDVHDFHPRPLAPEGERVARFDRLSEVDGALPVAVVQVRGTDEREE